MKKELVCILCILSFLIGFISSCYLIPKNISVERTIKEEKIIKGDQNDNL